MPLPLIGITMGDPTGIGPEIVVKALSMKKPFNACRPVVFGDRNVLVKTIRALGSNAKVKVVDEVPAERTVPQEIPLYPVSELEVDSLQYGKPDRACGKAMVRYVGEAVRWVESGRLDAITTCPVNKHAMNDAGYPFSGHTELLAHFCGVSSVAMMFVGSQWRVVLATTHLPIREVSKWITKVRVLNILGLTDRGMRTYFGIARPRIAVLGLNPHSGEEGLLGEEESTEIAPAIALARSQGMDVQGPFAADSFFSPTNQHTFDVVVSMYHDQGLIPMKMSGFETAVNVTLGLPFVRTSVGHGTAYDIAGKGMANPRNLVEAIVVASNLLKFKKK